MDIVPVDRRIWLRGEGCDQSYLCRRSDGKMCCMGQACAAFGVKAVKIKGLLGVGQFLALKNDIDQYKIDRHLLPLYRTNDDISITDAVRERELNRLAKPLGFGFKFHH